MYRYLSLGLLLVAILLLGILFYQVMAGFFLPLFLAALLVVIFRPMHQQILDWVKGRKKVASFLSTTVILLLVLVPLTAVGIMATIEGRSLIRRFDPAQMGQELKLARGRLGLELPAPTELRRMEQSLNAMKGQIVPSNLAEQRQQIAYDANELRALARELGAPLALAWPDGEPLDDDAPPPTRMERNWLQFAGTLQQIRSDLSDETWDALPDADAQQQQLATSRDNLQQATDEYFEFRTSLLGGPVREWLTDLANPDDETLRTWVDTAVTWGRDKVLSFGGATTAWIVQFAFGLLIMALALFSFFLDGPAMLTALKHLTPLDDAHEDELIQEFERVSRAVVLATLLSAIAQGLLGAIGYWFFGLDPVILLMLITMVLALVPFVGAAAVWVPCSLYIAFMEGRMGAGIGLAIYGTVIVSMADNVIKPFVLHGQSNLHPLWALLSVLGGVTALGPIGILVGPMVVAFLQTLLKILQRELMGMQDPDAADSGLESGAVTGGTPLPADPAIASDSKRSKGGTRTRQKRGQGDS